MNEDILVISIQVKKESEIASLIAVGPKDLAIHFLQKAGIHPISVSMHIFNREERRKMNRGEEYQTYQEKWTKGQKA